MAKDGTNRGRPLKYSVDDISVEKIPVFLDWCKEHNYIPDVEAMAEFFETTRKTLNDYEKKEEFSTTIKRFKNRIFMEKKQMAMKGMIPPAIFIFDAKNNSEYVDKQDIEHSGKIEMPSITITK